MVLIAGDRDAIGKAGTSEYFDYAMEGVPFQQLIWIPNAIYASTLRHFHGKWDQIIELALLRSDVGISVQNDHQSAILLARSLGKSATALCNSNCVFVLLVDSQYGAVVNIEGDINKFILMTLIVDTII
ncbi:hypothetical protein C4D60_Mb04t09780 [Musa balbisiana]|uniref:Uncharacterized protein n=1 Tax=Musa balbisiana TaxID=52838 RepID=A0A4S8KAY4_MUSBA|nr:hypothetical protein C4D60_Mb04t09780 [Musa balbisiana]